MSNFNDTFKNPPSSMRGMPFWAWNGKLDIPQLLRQIAQFKEMGLGGFYMHPRFGFDAEFMGDEFMQAVAACAKEAERLGMHACLYDEDKYPSGAAGGLVTQDEAYRQRHMHFTPEYRVGANLLAAYEITLADGFLQSYRQVDGSTRGDNIWYLYWQTNPTSTWYNNYTYLDTLNPAAVQKFIDTVHNKYHSQLSQYFGGVIPTIFTDEPSFGSGVDTLSDPYAKQTLSISFTNSLEQSYIAKYGESFIPTLPEIIWQSPDGKPSAARYRFYNHITDTFAQSFSGTIGAWCAAHNISFTGHMNNEKTLGSQTNSNGEVMRSLHHFQIPGIDILFNQIEYTTAKQAQSVARQNSTYRVASELYGTTGWDFDFRGHKFQGDWQAALGVTDRVHHLAWSTMEGEAKHDYPASFCEHSPWYKQYPLIEDHFARVNAALRSGTPECRVGVIHPIESYWLQMGPNSQTSESRADLEYKFKSVTEWLLHGLIDFDYISEAILAETFDGCENGALSVGASRYQAVVIPGCTNLRESTIAALEQFAANGGIVVIMGNPPATVELTPSDRITNLPAARIEFTQHALLTALESVRTIDIRTADCERTNSLIYQLVDSTDHKWLFIARAIYPENLDMPISEQLNISIEGIYTPTLYNTLDGTTTPCPHQIRGSKTIIPHELYEYDSLLIQLTPNPTAAGLPQQPTPEYEPLQYLPSLLPYTLSEPNVLLLDSPQYALDDEPFNPADDTKHIDSIVLQRLGHPAISRDDPQPWTDKSDKRTGHTLRLRYTIESEIEIHNAHLAIEKPAEKSITFNGSSISTQPIHWYVDPSIKTIALPAIKKGINTLEIEQPILRKESVQWCYILGSFGVRVRGRHAQIVPLPEKIAFADWTSQEFPFYGGNITYRCDIDLPRGDYALQINKYRCPVLTIKLDDNPAQPLAFPPFIANLGTLSGKHTLEITAYGNRYNTFGPVHFCDEFSDDWCNAIVYRYDNEKYSPEYHLKRTGILRAPRLLRLK